VFTGLIADLGSVTAVEQGEAGSTLRIATRLAGELHEGDSIAVSGVCLTASMVDDQGFAAEAMIETLRRSSLGLLLGGEQVNLELPLRAEDRLGGHIVQGHVDATGIVEATRAEGFSRVLEIATEPRLQRYLVEKGSVALDGVSLTLSALSERGFAVSLIPETLVRTTLGGLGEGSLVNVEVDVLAKHVERLMGAYPQAATTEVPSS
jgi:riboflavin synthase